MLFQRYLRYDLVAKIKTVRTSFKFIKTVRASFKFNDHLTTPLIRECDHEVGR